MIKKIIVIGGLLTLVGCATSQNYQQVVDNWRGANIQQLTQSWGEPQSEARLPNGDSVYMYLNEQLYSAPNFSQPGSGAVFNAAGQPILQPGYYSQAPGRTMSLHCRTWFEANPQGIITNVTYQGNSCISASARGKTPS